MDASPTLDVQLEGLLFYKATPQKKKTLCKLLNCSDAELQTHCQLLAERLTGGATRLLETDTELQLVTATELDEMIESLRKDDLKRDIGKAGAETLAIILYRGPISRVEIDRIRGVNSGFILRNLLIRGLVERTSEGRTHTFSVTPTLLTHLGITEKTALPDYSETLDQLDAFEAEAAAANE